MTEKLLVKQLLNSKPVVLDDVNDRIMHLSVNDIRALLDEHKIIVMSKVSERLSSSLGECVRGNDYELIAGFDGEYWLMDKDVNSGETLKQWVDGVMNLR